MCCRQDLGVRDMIAMVRWEKGRRGGRWGLALKGEERGRGTVSRGCSQMESRLILYLFLTLER